MREIAAALLIFMFLAITCRFVTEPFANGFNPQTEQPAPAPATTTTGELPDGVERFVDEEAGVVCWLVAVYSDASRPTGISCLPLDETKLESSGQ